MEQKKKYQSALRVNGGVSSPPNINPFILKGRGSKTRKKYSLGEYVDGILTGNRTILSQAITLTESSLPEHYELAQSVIERCLPYSARSVRIGITGVPGVGKSTFIDEFGMLVLGEGRKLAVLAIDPSSDRTKGSILGDKTRMERLSLHPDAFIRPSPSAGRLGGVARKTRESIILCEAAGFNTIIVETVGVGQSETSVHTMVDFFLLLMLAGAGDELQGIKRGIMEMADAIAITKADGQNSANAENAKILFQNALNMFPAPESGWSPRVMTCSSQKGAGIKEVWVTINDYMEFASGSGYLEKMRKKQAVERMHDTILEYLNNSFYNNSEVRRLLPQIEENLNDSAITSYKAAIKLIDKYNKNICE
jgi:LAO/AO transport system kinase